MIIHNFKVALAVVVLGLAMSMQSASAAATAKPVSVAADAEATAPAGAVVIGDFEGKATSNKQYGTLILNHGHREFGWGWSTTTDQRVGGHSVANIALIHPGADGTHGALQISGEIKSGFPYPWAGAIWFPGHEPMQPGDLSAKKELSFWARGKPGSYNLMLMSGGPSSIPLYASFVTTSTWKEYHISLAVNFPNADWKQVYFIAFSAANPGKFQFDLDQVALH